LDNSLQVSLIKDERLVEGKTNFSTRLKLDLTDTDPMFYDRSTPQSLDKLSAAARCALHKMYAL